MTGFVDVHSHVVPSGDDGSRTIEEGLELCRRALETGTEILFATPHAHAEWDTFPRTPERDAQYATALAAMREVTAGWGLDLRGGWEVYPTELASRDPAALVLEGTRAVLVEFPGSWLEIEDALEPVEAAVAALEAARLVPVLAHPERCRAVAAEPHRVRQFAQRGALLCLNAPSLVGGHGEIAQRTAWTLLDDGVIALVASDAHSARRPPTLDEAYEEVRRRLGEAVTRPLFDGSALPWI